MTDRRSCCHVRRNGPSGRYLCCMENYRDDIDLSQFSPEAARELKAMVLRTCIRLIEVVTEYMGFRAYDDFSESVCRAGFVITDNLVGSGTAVLKQCPYMTMPGQAIASFMRAAVG